MSSAASNRRDGMTPEEREILREADFEDVLDGEAIARAWVKVAVVVVFALGCIVGALVATWLQ